SASPRICRSRHYPANKQMEMSCRAWGKKKSSQKWLLLLQKSSNASVPEGTGGACQASLEYGIGRFVSIMTPRIAPKVERRTWDLNPSGCLQPSARDRRLQYPHWEHCPSCACSNRVLR